MAAAELGRTNPTQTGWLARPIRSPAVFAAAGLFLIFIGLMSGHLYSFDGLLYFRGAEALVLDRSLVFDPPVIWGGPISRSIMPIGFSLVQMPAVLLAESAGSLRPPPTTALYDPALLYGDPVATLASWVNPLLVALTGALIIHTAERLGAPRRAAVLVAVAVIFGSPLVFYARADFAQPLTALLLVGIVALVIEAIQGRTIAPGLAMGAVALSILTRPVDGLMVAFAAFLVLCLPIRGCPPIRDRRRLGVEMVAGVLTGIAATMAVNAIRFGAPLDFGFRNRTLRLAPDRPGRRGPQPRPRHPLVLPARDPRADRSLDPVASRFPERDGHRDAARPDSTRSSMPRGNRSASGPGDLAISCR